MAFYFSSVTKALYDTDVFPVASLPANKVEITQAAYTDLMTKQNQGYVILADGSGNPYTVNQSEATATDIKHAASVANTLALGHVKIGNTMTAANDGTIDVKDSAVSTSKLSDNAVTSQKVKDGAVGTSKLADGAVSTSKLSDNAVTADKVKDGAVGTSKLADDAITADKVKDNETLPVNISGTANFLTYARAELANSYGKYVKLIEIDTNSIGSNQELHLVVKFVVTTAGSVSSATDVYLRARKQQDNSYSYQARVYYNSSPSIRPYVCYDSSTHKMYLYAKQVNNDYSGVIAYVESCSNYNSGRMGLGYLKYYVNDTMEDSAPYTEIIYSVQYILKASMTLPVGSPSTPVYVDSNGQVQECNTPVVIDKILNLIGSEITSAEIITSDANNKFLGNVFISLSERRIIDFTLSFLMFARNSSNTPINEEITFTVIAGSREVFKTTILPSTTSASFISSLRCSFIANENEQIFIYVSRVNVNVAKVSLSLMKLQGIAIPVP